MSKPLPNRNLIVVAGAGTGKTYRLVETCIGQLRGGNVEIDEILIVTFTKAAAAELRQRIGAALQKAFEAESESAHLARQIALLDRAQISTLHSFCLELVSRHFSELGLSPRLITMEDAQATVLEREALDRLFENYYEGKSERAKRVKKLFLEFFRGDDEGTRAIVRKLHSFTQTRPNPREWFAEQRAFLAQEEPRRWREWHNEAVDEWLKEWRPVVAAQPDEKNPARAMILALMGQRNLSQIAALFPVQDKMVWPRGSKQLYRDPIEEMYETAAMLGGWMANGKSDPLLEDWNLTRGTILLLLEITEEFGEEFANLKRERGLVDFNDLEQFSLKLLWDGDRPSAVAESWRAKFKWIFVDEYQDINRAQDRIITALARPDTEGNRFLVGDVKQSIYGFRQAEPKVFLRYEENWGKGAGGTREFLRDNWRSHERILDFVNGLFSDVMPGYDENARLRFANDDKRRQLSAAVDSAPKVEAHLIVRDREEEKAEHDEEDSDVLADVNGAEAEARVIAGLCRRMAGEGVSYGEMVILMRAPASAVETFAKVFSAAGIPFDARRTGFFNCIEVLDFTNLLTILDNPLQDIPLLGVLRSPLGGFSVEDLATIRIGFPRGPFWEALLNIRNEEGVGKKVDGFLKRYERWRDLARHTSLAQRLEIILDETGYEAWALAQERGEQRRANIRRFVEVARQFDELRGEGLYPFLRHMEEQNKEVGDMAPAAVDSKGAVRLMSVHQSKGLQFPVVFVAGLAKRFNKRDFQGLFLLDEEFGLCARARPEGKRVQYETLAFWLAKQRQEERMREEEMRILYVALTRAERRLLLVGTAAKSAGEKWKNADLGKGAGSMMDWIGGSLSNDCQGWLDRDAGEARDWIWELHRDPPLVSGGPASSGDEFKASAEDLEKLRSRLEWKYPRESATRQEAKSSATALRRGLAEEPELARPLMKPRAGKLDASQIGQAAHKLLEHARLDSFGSAEGLRAEIARLKTNGVLSADEAGSVDAKKLAAFWESDFGRELLARPEALRRELIFTAKFSAEDLRSVGAPVAKDFGDDEFVVVQGAADLAALLEKEIWVVDFKTDRAPGKLLEYGLQLRIYALALEKIYKRPVTRACLHFLETEQTEWIRQPGYLPLM